jgi:hypothetical protein
MVIFCKNYNADLRKQLTLTIKKFWIFSAKSVKGYTAATRREFFIEISNPKIFLWLEKSAKLQILVSQGGSKKLS